MNIHFDDDLFVNLIWKGLNSGSKQGFKIRLNRIKLQWVRGRTAYKYDRERFRSRTSRYEVQPWIQGTTYYLRYEPRLSTRYNYIESIYHEVRDGARYGHFRKARPWLEQDTTKYWTSTSNQYDLVRGTTFFKSTRSYDVILVRGRTSTRSFNYEVVRLGLFQSTSIFKFLLWYAYTYKYHYCGV